ncbi:hypothetical protein EV696_101359 [Permianibacter aggregans]|uniref:Uncharacterized protein n=1 Tax=Permianibacter aggregans TaxID=1510150 RepID=A0A4R6UZD7_9GAMM|nr:hypothetical protein EV696_101359 [Permianibacter aggregans]
MSTSGLIMMLGTMGIVTAVTLYFFIRVLKAPDQEDEE